MCQSTDPLGLFRRKYISESLLDLGCRCEWSGSGVDRLTGNKSDPCAQWTECCQDLSFLGHRKEIVTLVSGKGGFT